MTAIRVCRICGYTNPPSTDLTCCGELFVEMTEEMFADFLLGKPLPNTTETLAVIAASCKTLGVKSANVEHPSVIHVEDDSFIGKPYMVIGDVNGPWACDVYRNVEAFNDGEQPACSIDVRAGHLKTAEGIARFAVGFMRHDHSLLAYASKREEMKADRPTRSGRR